MRKNDDNTLNLGAQQNTTLFGKIPNRRSAMVDWSASRVWKAPLSTPGSPCKRGRSDSPTAFSSKKTWHGQVADQLVLDRVGFLRLSLHIYIHNYIKLCICIYIYHISHYMSPNKDVNWRYPSISSWLHGPTCKVCTSVDPIVLTKVVKGLSVAIGWRVLHGDPYPPSLSLSLYI